MFGEHRVNSFLRLKIETVRGQGFGRLTKLAFLRQLSCASDVGDGLGLNGRFPSPGSTRRLAPQKFKTSGGEGGEALFDRSGFVFKFPLRGRKEEAEFVDGQGLDPFVDVGWVADDVKPSRVESEGELRSRCFRAMTKSSDAGREEVVDGEGKRWTGRSHHRLSLLA